ncbi:MAG: hypothetical protein U9R17_16635 [Thermodesulfobacteriota bacterium]|nr:hypothetical protein [Thermodesulfobacteriota bacterium]
MENRNLEDLSAPTCAMHLSAPTCAMHLFVPACAMHADRCIAQAGIRVYKLDAYKPAE